MKVFLVAGARPNFMKIAPIYRQSRHYPQVECKIVHTGQHYDHAMSDAFFTELELPKPDFFLEAGSASHAEQTARIMVRFEEICQKERPDLVIVVGDVNSTLACAVVAKKLWIDVAHVEAGLRSFDLQMPEEINRLVTDSITDQFFVTEPDAMDNLIREGKSEAKIHFVGHVMIDNLFFELEKMRRGVALSEQIVDLKKSLGGYAFMTLHRPSNVDDPEVLRRIMDTLNDLSNRLPIIFPVHPRTQSRLEEHAVTVSKTVVTLPPLSFRESLYLWKDAKLILTDSGGLQEESTALKVPCLTLRKNTERPVTVQMGSNLLVGNDPDAISEAFHHVLDSGVKDARTPPKWDGRAAERIWSVILNQDERRVAV